MAESNDSHSRAALQATASNTGWMLAGELLMTRKISAVAVCCSRASLSERCKAAYDGAGWALPPSRRRGALHSSQNFAAARFSCWHRGHVMPEPPSGRVGERSEPWAETTRPGLAWSRTRSLGPRLGMARPRSWLPHLHQPTADGQSGSALTPGKGRADFLGSVSSSSARLPAIRARRDHARSCRNRTALTRTPPIPGRDRWRPPRRAARRRGAEAEDASALCSRSGFTLLAVGEPV